MGRSVYIFAGAFLALGLGAAVYLLPRATPARAPAEEAVVPPSAFLQRVAKGPGTRGWFAKEATFVGYPEDCRKFWDAVLELPMVPLPTAQSDAELPLLRVAAGRQFLVFLERVIDRNACTKLASSAALAPVREATRDFLISCRSALEGVRAGNEVPRDASDCTVRFMQLRIALIRLGLDRKAPLNVPGLAAYGLWGEALREHAANGGTLRDRARRWHELDPSEESARIWVIAAYVAWLRDGSARSRAEVGKAWESFQAKYGVEGRFATEFRMALLRRTDWAAALAQAKALAEHGAHPALGHYYAGWIAYEAGDADEALHRLGKALRLEPANRTFHAAREELRAGLASGPPETIFCEELSSIGAAVVLDRGIRSPSAPLGVDFRALRGIATMR